MALTRSFESLDTPIFSATRCTLRVLVPVAYISATAATRAFFDRFLVLARGSSYFTFAANGLRGSGIYVAARSNTRESVDRLDVAAPRLRVRSHSWRSIALSSVIGTSPQRGQTWLRHADVIPVYVLNARVPVSSRLSSSGRTHIS